MSKSAAQLPDHPNCLNCGAELQGQYCGICGQRARGRLISLWELLQDAFGDLFEIDSRLWRTLIPLLIRPGRLTRDYLEGKRARYMPPFRMYLVLSVVFFVVAFFDPQDDLSLLFEPEPGPTPEEAAEKREEVEADVNEVLNELTEEGIITADQAEAVRDRQEDLPDWLKRRLTKERLEATCEKIGADEGKTLGNLVLDNIPIALFVLLPFMALVLKALYPLSRRYFVEHLLFFVHFHSFFFLILTLQILFARFAGLIHLPEAIGYLILVAASFYIPVYLYKAMRLVYGQGFFFTFIKYITLVIAYVVGATLTMLGALLFALVSV